MGRFLEVVSKEPSATIAGFDLTLAVESAYANIGARPNVHIVPADIMKPPFRQGSFDVVFSIGVLHHTSNPKAAFGKLVPLLKREGQIAIWVYSKPKRPYLSDFYRYSQVGCLGVSSYRYHDSWPKRIG
jgi:SAM-dependent methyltransferase